jgi:hypothetical protein
VFHTARTAALEALAAVLAVGSLTLLPGTASASATSEFPPVYVKCMKFLDSALTAVHQMNMANSAMAHAAGNGDVAAFKEAFNRRAFGVGRSRRPVGSQRQSSTTKASGRW